MVYFFSAAEAEAFKAMPKEEQVRITQEKKKAERVKKEEEKVRKDAEKAEVRGGWKERPTHTHTHTHTHTQNPHKTHTKKQCRRRYAGGPKKKCMYPHIARVAT